MSALAIERRMAKKKLKDDQTEPEKAGKKTKSVLLVRGTQEWAEWLQEYCRDQRMPLPVLIDQAIAEHAQKRGFKSPPER